MDQILIEAFRKGTVQLFVGSGLSCGIYPTSEEFRDNLLDEKIHIKGKLSSLREFIGSSVTDLRLEDAAQFFELYAGEDGLMRKVTDEP